MIVKKKAKGELIFFFFLEKKRKNEGGRGSSFIEVVETIQELPLLCFVFL